MDTCIHITNIRGKRALQWGRIKGYVEKKTTDDWIEELMQNQGRL